MQYSYNLGITQKVLIYAPPQCKLDELSCGYIYDAEVGISALSNI